ncbi:hypothetical protein CC80DRAFT_503574 [Byssothecium circinans]|uniref:BTB domain-containing protein n=1 Tax=Byssothecium circinans TaxID=147558 RepID=A0A6A5U270_9PLEO|nr:hypothetical protein CC80DRAFT_503574 [Byssothecium circinans]
MTSNAKIAVAESKVKTGSSKFYAELLETGMFSDITIVLDKKHKFKAHTTILAQKTNWTKCLFTIDTAKQEMVLMVRLGSVEAFKSSLSFCYTGSYTTTSKSRLEEAKHHLDVPKSDFSRSVEGLHDFASGQLESIITIASQTPDEKTLFSVANLLMDIMHDPVFTNFTLSLLRDKTLKQLHAYAASLIRTEDYERLVKAVPSAAAELPLSIGPDGSITLLHCWTCNLRKAVFKCEYPIKVSSKNKDRPCPRCP